MISTASGVLILALSCAAQDARPAPEPVAVRLEPRTPGQLGGMRWSPKGDKVPLSETESGLRGRLALGREGTKHPILFELRRFADGSAWDTLVIDRNRDGEFADETPLTSVPSLRGRATNTSFRTAVPVPITDPWTQQPSSFDYGITFWYVDDPETAGEPPVIRFSRSGWMEGEALLDGVPALVLVTESKMDGVFDQDDSWALAPEKAPGGLKRIDAARPVTRHAWLGEQAYRLVKLDPSGLKLTLTPHDPGITRAEEKRQDDPYLADKEEKHSGDKVIFLLEYRHAAKLSKTKQKPLFIDFTTTWCGPCKTMERLVYNADRVVQASRKVISVQLDGDVERELVKRFSVEAYPTMILLDPEGKELRRLVGYQSVAKLVEFLGE